MNFHSIKSIDEEIKTIKNNFEYIKSLRSEITQILGEIETKLNALTKIYVSLIKTHKDIDFTFGLDSFFFQNKLIETDAENMNKVFNCINNQMYGEYYKLYRMLFDYINHNIKDSKLLEETTKKSYPGYKDLEPLKNYDFALVVEIQTFILKIIQNLQDYLNSKQMELNNDSTQSLMGINIENIINYQHYSNALLQEKINMFCRYLDVFYKHHHKYFSRLLLKSKMMLGIVNEDINLKKGLSKKSNLPKQREREKENITMETHEEGGSTTPSSIDETDEHNMKKFINYAGSSVKLQDELNTIIGNIPQKRFSTIRFPPMRSETIQEPIIKSEPTNFKPISQKIVGPNTFEPNTFEPRKSDDSHNESSSFNSTQTFNNSSNESLNRITHYNTTIDI